MIAPLFVLLQVLAAAPPDSQSLRDGLVLDGVNDAPVSDAVVRAQRVATRSRADGTFRIGVGPADTLRVTRLGYRELVVAVSALPPGVMRLRLVPAVVPLEGIEVRAAGEGTRAAITRPASEARAHGATSAAELAASLPLVSARATTSRTAFSIRGSRAEQVVVTLDGVPLNDPSTGIADPSDVPLGAIASATVVPGSDAARFGSGASGGVIAFRSGSSELLAVGAGSYGARSVEAAWPVTVGALTVRSGVAWSTADNDFEFRNVAAAPPADTLERRTNADVSRRALFASLLSPRVQLLALTTDTERGLAGPMNARDFDDDRGRTRRTLARLVGEAHGWELSGGVRSLRSEFSDPRNPSWSSDVSALSADAAVARSAHGFALRAGGGADRVRGTAISARSRPRAFALVAREHRVARLRADIAARVDHVGDAGTHFSPSLAIGTYGALSLSARVAAGFRAPSFYDLYLSTPQRVFARELRPERMTSDIELRVERRPASATALALQWGVSMFARRTTDAIVWLPGNVGWSPHNVARERVRGAEAHAALAWREWSLDGWSAAYDTRLWDGYLETRTPYVPYLAGGAGLAWRRAGTTAQGGVRYTGRRPFVNGPSLPELELPASATVRLAVAHMIRLGSTAITLHFGVDDLADRRAEEVRRYPSPGRTLSAGFVLQPESPK